MESFSGGDLQETRMGVARESPTRNPWRAIKGGERGRSLLEKKRKERGKL